MKVGLSGIFELYNKNKYGIVKNQKMYLKNYKGVKITSSENSNISEIKHIIYHIILL